MSNARPTHCDCGEPVLPVKRECGRCVSLRKPWQTRVAKTAMWTRIERASNRIGIARGVETYKGGRRG
jgi:hypothetical protein